MAVVTFANGDVFRFQEGYGIVLSGTEAVMVTGEGGRRGYKITKGVLPANAIPFGDHLEMLPYEIRLAFQVVQVALE